MLTHFLGFVWKALPDIHTAVAQQPLAARQAEMHSANSKLDKATPVKDTKHTISLYAQIFKYGLIFLFLSLSAYLF